MNEPDPEPSKRDPVIVPDSCKTAEQAVAWLNQNSPHHHYFTYEQRDRVLAILDKWEKEKSQ